MSVFITGDRQTHASEEETSILRDPKNSKFTFTPRYSAFSDLSTFARYANLRFITVNKEVRILDGTWMEQPATAGDRAGTSSCELSSQL